MMQYLSIRLFVFMPIIFLIYGMSFFMLGVIIAVESLSHARQGRLKNFIGSPLGALTVFGLLHGLFEFIGIFNIFYGDLILPLKAIRLFILPASFYYLCEFGASYGRGPTVRKAEKDALSLGDPIKVSARFARRLSLPGMLFGVWLLLCFFFLAGEGLSGRWFTAAEILARYLIGLPGAIMAAFAVAARGKEAAPALRKYLMAASVGFAFYAVALSISPKTDFFPASIFNYETFYRTMHVPTQVFRTVCALVITFSMIRFFRLSKDFTSIRFKAVLHVIVAVVIPAFCIILLVSYLMADALLKLSYKENERIASLAADRILDLLNNIDDNVKYHIFFSRASHSIDKKEVLMSLVRENADVNGVIFLDRQGEILRIEKDASSQGISYRGLKDGDRIRNALKSLTPETVRNDFYMGGHDERNISMVLPLADSSVEVLLDVKKLYAITSDLMSGKNWRMFLVDNKGGFVPPGTRSQLIGRDAVGSDRYRYGKTKGGNGILFNAIEEKIGPTGWSVVLEIPRSDIVSPVFEVFKGLVTGIILVYLSAVAVAILFVRRVTKPIDLIAERVRSIGREDFTGVLNINTGDEIQMLSEEVEKMAALLVEKKNMEKQMMQTEKIASLGRLVAGVAHEINNPLGVILGYCQVLQRETGQQDRHYEDLKMIERYVLSCKKIVGDLLQFSRTNVSGLKSIEVDINTNISEALSLVSKHFSKNNISIVFNPDPSSPKITGDPDKLHQVFLNLAMNALDAMKKEGGSLTVGTRVFVSGSERLVEVTFADTGCGISQADIVRIFDPFFTTKAVGEGTGLGLSVSYGIVKDHEGKIWVESAEGKGATFHVVFPFLREHEQ